MNIQSIGINPYYLFFWKVLGWLHDVEFKSSQGGELEIFVEFRVDEI